LQMDITIESDGCRRTLDITVPADEVRGQWKKTLKAVSAQAQVPGFRKGHAPEDLVLSRYRELLREETVQALVSTAYSEAIEDKDLDPITLPRLQVDEERFNPEAELQFTATLEVRPQVTLGEYTGLSVEREKTEVTDGQVSDFLEQKREEHAQFRDIDARPLARGDWALVDVTVLSPPNEEPVHEKEGVLLPIGQGAMPDELDEKLIGASPGDTVEAQVQQAAPEAEGESDAPQTLAYKVTVREIKERTLLEIDDEFAKTLGDFESLDDLRGHVRRQMEQAADEQSDRGARQAALDTVIESSSAEVPISMLTSELEYMIYMTQAMYGEAPDVNKLAEDLRPLAERQVKATLILEAIADAEGIEPEPAVVQQTVMRETARMSDEDKDRWFAEGGPDRTRRTLRRRAAMDLVMEKATVTDKEESRIIVPGAEGDTGGGGSNTKPSGGLIIQP